MRVTPRSEQELQESLVIPKGIYAFEVASAEDAVSKSGNEMIKLQLRIWDAQGKVHFIYDYLLDSLAFKLRHFAEYTGLIEKYNMGGINAEDCLYKSGSVELMIQEAKDNYPMKNAVKDYVKTDRSAKVSAPDVPFEDDLDIPF